MGDRTRDDVMTQRVSTGKRVTDARDLRRRTREGEGIRTGPKTVSEPAPDPTAAAWPPADDES